MEIEDLAGAVEDLHARLLAANVAIAVLMRGAPEQSQRLLNLVSSDRFEDEFMSGLNANERSIAMNQFLMFLPKT